MLSSTVYIYVIQNKDYQDGKHEDDNEVVIEEMHGNMGILLCIISLKMVSFIFLHAYIVYTEPVMQQCTRCNRDYRTYIPDTICRLPDGGCTMYQDPQLTCPMCDPMGYGDFMNADIFPELHQKQVEELKHA